MSKSLALKDCWLDKTEHKNIKSILGDLNSKLKKCRLKHSKDTQLSPTL